MAIPRISPTHLLIVAAATTYASVSALATDPAELVRAAVRLPCQSTTVAGLSAAAHRLPGVELQQTWVQYSQSWAQFSPQGVTGRRLVFAVGEDRLAVRFTGPIGSPDHVEASYGADRGRRPVLDAIADPTCTIHSARRLEYDQAQRAAWLRDLDDALRPRGAPEPLNPPVPAGVDPGGITVGIIDSGVNYLLPEIASRLARGPDGEILGYDYADLDRRPFDVAPSGDPFHPERHGTRTASLVLEGAPVARLVPYRYPHHDMARMAALVEDAAARGVRVMNLSLSSFDPADWRPFQAAATAHPEILFVIAAGNHGRDIDVGAVYPAGLRLDNALVVTAATADGRLLEGVNWGASGVDLMAPGENVDTLDFDGQRRPVSGSSYATARVSALAACLLADHPEWSTAALRAALLQVAEPDRSGRVARGVVPETALGTRGACAGADARRAQPVG
jgi:subtilisin family serine protease